MRALGNVIAAELVKLRGQPSAYLAILGTVAASITISAALAASSPVGANAQQITLLSVPFLQIGTVLVGVLTVGTEYTGRQIRTTLTATPRRPLLILGKVLTYLIAGLATSSAAVGAGTASAAITLAARNAAPTERVTSWPLAGAIGYLVLIGLLGFALSTLLRSVIPPLVTMLGILLIVSPLIGGSAEYARWLPDRAASSLYLPTIDSPFAAGTGALILFAWITVIAVTGLASFVVRDG